MSSLRKLVGISRFWPFRAHADQEEGAKKSIVWPRIGLHLKGSAYVIWNASVTFKTIQWPNNSFTLVFAFKSIVQRAFVSENGGSHTIGSSLQPWEGMRQDCGSTPQQHHHCQTSPQQQWDQVMMCSASYFEFPTADPELRRPIRNSRFAGCDI